MLWGATAMSTGETTQSETATGNPRERPPLLAIVITAVATLAIVLAGQLLWRGYQDGRQGALVVETNASAAVGELLDGDGNHVIRAFTVPTQLPLRVPTGQYQLRVAHPGHLSTTCDFHLPREHVIHLNVDDEPPQLWSIDVRGEFFAIPSDDGTDIVAIAGDGVRCYRGKTGRLDWQFDPAAHLDELREAAPGLLWPDKQFAIDRRGTFRRGTWRVAQSTDLSGDAIADVVIASGRQAWLLALDGLDGKLLWLAARGSDVVSPSTELLARQYRSLLISAVIDGPHLTDDVDADGIPDLLVTCADTQHRSDEDDSVGETLRWVEAVSGVSGETIWRADLPDDWFALAAGETAPAALSWFLEAGTWSSGGGGGGGYRFTRRRGHYEKRAQRRFIPSPVELFPDTPKSTAMLFCGQSLLTIDTSNGEQLRRDNFDASPELPVRYANLAGDASVEVIAVSPIVAAKRGSPDAIHVAAWSLTEQRPLWSKEFPAAFPSTKSSHSRRPDYPLAEDLDGDGLCELILPTETPEISRTGTPWGELSVLEGATGEQRWTRRVPTADQQVDHFLAGPDINGDGHREVFAATIWGHEMEVYVDCLSGKDGSTLWRTSHMMRLYRYGPNDFYVQPLSWWQDGDDGWPQLIVPVLKGSSGEEGQLLFFSAATGRVTHTAHGISQTHAADLDGDGYEDLLVYSPTDDRAGKLRCVRGGVVDRLRSVSSHWQSNTTRVRWKATADFDRDGIDDLVQFTGDGVLRAVSTASGSLLWEANAPKLRQPNDINVISAARLSDPDQLDLNGDSVPDVVLSYNSSQSRKYSPVLALSGRDGRKLWEAGFQIVAQNDRAHLAIADKPGNGRIDIAVLGVFRENRASAYEGLSLVMLDGRSGQVSWRDELITHDTAWPGIGNASWFDNAFADLDNDQGSEVLLFGDSKTAASRFEVRAYSGAGRELWTEPISAHAGVAVAYPFATTDLDHDGRNEIVVLEPAPQGQASQVQARVLDSRDGTLRFKWKTTVDDFWLASHASKLRTLLLRRATGGPYMCISLADSLNALTIVDSAGKPLPIVKPPGTGVLAELYQEPIHASACDVDGDGNDELVVATNTRLAVVQPESRNSPIWATGIDSSDRVLEVASAMDAAPGVIVLLDSGREEVVGLDATNGKRLWTCPTAMPWVRHSFDQPLQVLFNRQLPEQPPHVLFKDGLQAVCRRAMPVRAEDVKTKELRIQPTLPTVGRDPRLAIRLPWNPYSEFFNWQRNLVFGAWSSLLAVTLIVIPGRLAGHFMVHRQWSMRTMFVVPVVVGLMILMLRVEGPYFDWNYPSSRWLCALTALPGLFFVYYVGRSLVLRQWRALQLFGLVTLAASVVLGLVAGAPGLKHPGEYYTLEGWYFIVLYGAYAIGCMMVLGVPIHWLATNVRRRR